MRTSHEGRIRLLRTLPAGGVLARGVCAIMDGALGGDFIGLPEGLQWGVSPRTHRATLLRQGRSFRDVLGPLYLTPRNNTRDPLDRVPIAVGGRNAQKFFQLTKIADRFHVTAIQSQNKPVLDRNNLERPVVSRRQS